jgi:hypothetical protein
MSKSEILSELSKLTPEERQELRVRLAELDEEDWLDEGLLCEAEKALIEERLRDLDASPERSIPWEQAKASLLAPFQE